MKEKEVKCLFCKRGKRLPRAQKVRARANEKSRRQGETPTLSVTAVTCTVCGGTGWMRSESLKSVQLEFSFSLGKTPLSG